MDNEKTPINPQMHTRFGEGKNDLRLMKDEEKTMYSLKFGGLNKREHFSGLAMQGLLSNAPVTEFLSGNNGMQVPDLIAEYSIQFADALLEKLSIEEDK